jgi:hypothetical protein
MLNSTRSRSPMVRGSAWIAASGVVAVVAMDQLLR